MAITLTLGNRFVQVEGANLKTIRAIDKVCTYKVEGYFFSPAYRARRWDGKEHLFKFSKSLGYHAPSGMAQDIAELLREKGLDYEVKFTTKIKAKRRELTWNPKKKLRGYQREAVCAILGKPIPGRGVIKMPIRSGKTLTMARVIWNLGLPTLFVVPSKSLMYQTIKGLRVALPDAEVGQVGDSVYDPKFITVATIHTLSEMAPKKKKGERDRQEAHPDYRRLMNMFDVACFDEAHHIRGTGEWYRIFMEINARFKIGLSATVFFDNKKEQERGIIWLRASCGPVRIDIPAGRLIREGFLLPQHVKMYKCGLPIARGSRWSATLKKKCITENPYRNKMIADLVAKHAPMKTIVIAKEHKHINAICEELNRLGIDHKTITGRDKQNAREEKIEGLVSGEYNVLVGNVVSEGIDIPAVECVVNAEGGRDEKATWQRQRNLTVMEGGKKEPPVMIDIYDQMSPYFEKHAKARLKTYRSEEEFKVEVLEWEA